MERYYTIPEIAHRLTINSHNNLFSQETVYKWISQKKLEVERIPENIRGFGKYPYWIKGATLMTALNRMGYDADELFPDNDTQPY
ncbi:hypothetical protein [Paenibacillus odorifer]|uniref:hypothetical protein n=1 Tax=Paenibacillus odorifer TaxID=189426 RepID=UPI00096D9EE4|nr:hypothetical protein [Paenibacillus odorifer]OMD17952.1 hypothetical protein BJP47_16740 [Paenibacillus odorifer]